MKSFIYWLQFKDKNRARIRHDYLPEGQQKGIVVYFVGKGVATEYRNAFLNEARERGLEVVTFEWPGQGDSGRFLPDPGKVHTDSMDRHFGYMDEFHASRIFSNIQKRAKRLSVPLIGMGESWGGHMLLRQANRDAKTASLYDGKFYINPAVSVHVGPIRIGKFHIKETALTRVLVFLAAKALVKVGLGKRYAPGQWDDPIEHYKNLIAKTEKKYWAKLRKGGRVLYEDVMNLYRSMHRWKSRIEVLERCPERVHTNGATLGFLNALNRSNFRLWQEVQQRAHTPWEFDKNQAILISKDDKTVVVKNMEAMAEFTGMKVYPLRAGSHDPTMHAYERRKTLDALENFVDGIAAQMPKAKTPTPRSEAAHIPIQVPGRHPMPMLA